MFTGIHLRNFMSFADLEAVFLKKAKDPKHLVMIYGENGAGKSNLINAFYVLWLTTQSLRMQIERSAMAHNTVKEKNTGEDDLEFVINRSPIHRFYMPVEWIIKEFKTIDSDGPMELVFDFQIGQRQGSYTLQFIDNELIYERLVFASRKRKTVLYELSKGNLTIRPALFRDKAILKKVRGMLNNYFGKHSCLSILNSLKDELSEDGFRNGIDSALQEVLDELTSFSVSVQDRYGSFPKIIRNGIEGIPDLEEGRIGKTEVYKLYKYENILNQILPQISSSIRSVEYELKEGADKVEYSLRLNKQICGKIRSIPFNRESKGIHTLLDLIPNLLRAMEGTVVVMDDFDEGIHDLAVDVLIEGLYDQIKGQLIVTTHNTSLMELDIPNDAFYIYDFDAYSNKDLISIADFERSHPNLNLRKRYLSGLYGGIPDISEIDFSEISDGE